MSRTSSLANGRPLYVADAASGKPGLPPWPNCSTLATGLPRHATVAASLSRHALWNVRCTIGSQLLLLLGHLWEQKVGKPLDVVLIRKPGVMQDIALVPEFLDDGGRIRHGASWHRLSCLCLHTDHLLAQPRVAVPHLFAALDQGQSSGLSTKPAATGFRSMYARIRANSASLRTQ